MTDRPATTNMANAPSSHKVKWSVFLFVLTVVCVGLTSSDIGYTRDEGYYFKAGRDYFGWFQYFGIIGIRHFLKPFESNH